MAFQASVLLLSSLIFTIIISTCRADYNVTVYPEESASLFKYVGDWSSGAATETIGDSAAFNFTGTALYLMMYRGPDCGQATITLDGKSYPFDGFSPQAQDMVCGLCIDELPLQEHFMNVTLVSHGRSTVENFTYLLMYDIIYTTNGSDPNAYPSDLPYNSGTPSPASPSSGVSIPLVVGATVGVIAVILSSGVAVYFYRRNRRLAVQSQATAWQHTGPTQADTAYNNGYDMQYRQGERPDLSRLVIPGSQGAYAYGGWKHGGPTPSGGSLEASEYEMSQQQPQMRPLLSEKQRLRADGASPLSAYPAESSVHGSEAGLSRGPSTYSRYQPDASSHEPMPPAMGVEQLRAQVERLANMIEDREAPPPAYDGDDI